MPGREPPDWLNLGPGYAQALGYINASLGGYLRLRADRDFVMVLIGDHQPPAMVTGEGAPWDVPVHVITSRARGPRSPAAAGIPRGTAAAAPGRGEDHALLPVLLDAFGDQVEPGTDGRPGLSGIRGHGIRNQGWLGTRHQSPGLSASSTSGSIIVHGQQ